MRKAITLPVERKHIFCARSGAEDDYVFVAMVLEFEPQAFPYCYSGGALEVVAAIVNNGHRQCVSAYAATERLHRNVSPNPPKEGVGSVSRSGKKVLLCIWDNGFRERKPTRNKEHPIDAAT